jgi:hypothetical protein
MKKSIPYIIIFGLIVFIGIREWNRPGPPFSETLTITDTIPGDSIPYSVEIEKKIPVPIYIDTGSTRWRDRPIDTAVILKDYFATRFYSDTLMNDTSAFILLKCYTTENRLFYQELMFQNRRPIAINTTVFNPPDRNKIFLGGGINLIPGKPGLSGDLLFVHKKGKMSINGGYDFMNRMITAKLFFKVKFKK